VKEEAIARAGCRAIENSNNNEKKKIIIIIIARRNVLIGTCYSALRDSE
jgi:hypothetical protein